MTMWAFEFQPESGPKYEQIARAIERDIAVGKLSPGDRLPPQRKLAKRLEITIGTVGRAYALAEQRGLTKSEVGRGCYVCHSSQKDSPPDGSRLVIDLGVNFPPDVSQHSLFEKTLNEFSRRRNLDELFGSLPIDAYERHRQAAVRWLKPRVDCRESDVLISTGTQSALIASLATLAEPGDSVYVESQTFPGIIAALRLLRLHPIPITMDSQGVLPDQIDGQRAKVIYLNPTNQNPTSTHLSLARRREIADLVHRHGMWLLEDDTYGQLCPQAPPAISRLIPERSILIASLSKSLAVGLRLALISSPKALRNQIMAQLQATSFIPSTLALEVATKWIEDGTGERLVKTRIEIARRRRQILKEILAEELLASAPILNHAWLQLPDSWTANSLCRAARENGVALLPSQAFAPTPECQVNCVRVALGAARTDEELKVGLSKIGRLLDPDAAPQSTRF